MHAQRPVLVGDLALFGLSGGWQVPASILLLHAAYGLVMGALYTRPVGAPAGKSRIPQVRPGPAPPPCRPDEAAGDGLGELMFATGIECSYPTLDGGRWRVDEM